MVEQVLRGGREVARVADLGRLGHFLTILFTLVVAA